MDQTFKVFDMMLKHRYKGQLDVDPEYAENACVVDYKKMLQAKVQAAQKNVDDHFQGWEATQMAKLIEEKLKAIAEAEKKEEEEQALKFRELRGENVSVLPEPINDDETIAKQKKAAEEAEAIQIATKAIEAKLEADKRQIYETKLNDLEYIADNYRAQLDDPQLKGIDHLCSK